MENKEKLEIIKNNFLDNLDKITAFDASMVEDQGKLKAIILSVRAQLKKNPELKAKDVKEELVSFEETAQTMTLKEQDIRKFATLTVEYYTLCRLLDIKVEISQDKAKLLESMIAHNISLFGVIGVDKKVEVINQDLYTSLTAQMHENLGDDAFLESMLQAPVFRTEM